MVVRPLPVNISRMHRPESLFFHSGRTTTLGLVARIQSANRAILLPPPWQMLRLTIRMPIAETVRGLNDARRHSCRYRGIAAPGQIIEGNNNCAPDAPFHPRPRRIRLDSDTSEIAERRRCQQAI